MQIQQVDPEDGAAIDVFHRIQVAVSRSDRPSGYVPAPVERTVAALRGGSGMAVTAFLGWLGDTPVASGWCGAYGEPPWAYVVPRVLPEFRRRGYGTAVLRWMEDQGPLRGCPLWSSGTWAAAHGPAGVGSAAAGFASRQGWELGRVDVRSRLALPVGAERLAALAAEQTGRRRGYTITAWAGPIPETLLAGWDALERPSPERPSGTAAGTSALRHRNAERRLAARGELKFSAVACSPAGDVVGSTFLTAGVASSEPAAQQRTFVSPEHRGRGLGLAMKVELLALLERDRPDIPAILTTNAVANGPILAVNEPLGYVRTSYSGSFRTRDRLAEALIRPAPPAPLRRARPA